MARDTNFYYSFLVLPPDKRRAIVAVWDFCRAVDDAVDEAGESGTRPGDEIARWREELARRVRGTARRATPQGRALVPLIRPVQPSARGVRGADRRGRDGSRRRALRDVRRPVRILHPRRVGGRPDLRRDLRYGDPRSRQYAIDLGVALQLTNILRDVPEDLARGRVYIPAGRPARATGVLRRTWRAKAPKPAAACARPRSRRCSRQQGAARARLLPARGGRRCRAADARRLVAAEIMGAIYRGILDSHRARRTTTCSAASSAFRVRGAR